MLPHGFQDYHSNDDVRRDAVVRDRLFLECPNRAGSDANADAHPRANTIAGDPPSADCEPRPTASK